MNTSGYTIQISIEDSYYGAVKELEIDKFTHCSDCDGIGGETQICTSCNGSGVFVQQNGFMSIQTTCPYCGGQGKRISKKCNTCNGTGFTTTKEKTKLHIPAGAKTNSRLLIKGKGKPGKYGGPAGDAIITVILNDINNCRINNDFVYHCKIKLSELLCGCTKTITVCNDNISFDIPELYNIENPIIIPKKGFKDIQTGSTGNLIIVLSILLPNEKLSLETKQNLINLENLLYDGTVCQTK